jgi:hypothetical protein
MAPGGRVSGEDRRLRQRDARRSSGRRRLIPAERPGTFFLDARALSGPRGFRDRLEEKLGECGVVEKIGDLLPRFIAVGPRLALAAPVEVWSNHDEQQMFNLRFCGC